MDGFPSGNGLDGQYMIKLCGIFAALCMKEDSHEESPSSESEVGIHKSATRGQETVKFHSMAFECATQRETLKGVIKHKGLQIKI